MQMIGINVLINTALVASVHADIQSEREEASFEANVAC